MYTVQCCNCKFNCEGAFILVTSRMYKQLGTKQHVVMFQCFHYYVWICDLWSVNCTRDLPATKATCINLRFSW